MIKLMSLYLYLKKIGQDDDAESLKSLIKEVDEDDFLQDAILEPEEASQYISEKDDVVSGVMPSFQWLLDGNLFKSIYKRRPTAYSDFLDLNSEELMNFSNPKYLGSGAMADAWTVNDGKVLKIFDTNSYAGNQGSPIKQYKEMYNSQWSANYNDESIKNPMIYGIGVFDNPDSMTYMMADNDYTHDYINLAWVLMEKVTTVGELADRYIRDSGTDIYPNIENDSEYPEHDDDDDDDWDLDDLEPEVENPNFKLEELYDIYENSYIMKEYVEDHYGKSFREIDPKILIKNMVGDVVTSIVHGVEDAIDQYESEEYQWASDADEYENEDDWIDSRLTLDDESDLSKFIYDYLDNLLDMDDSEGVLNKDSIRLTEKILGINQIADLENSKIREGGRDNSWLHDIIMESERKKGHGYADTHSENFGFRKEVDEDGNYKNRPIYFDA
jgi:hypothetical protein